MIQFRAATVSDAAKINEVIHRAFRLYADELGPDSHVKALEEPQEKVLDDIAHNFVLAAEENGEVIGSIRIKRLNDDVAYVYRFGVDPLVRNAGVGSELLQAAIDYCKQKGYAAMALHTNSKYFKLARYYYGKKFYVQSTSTAKGYIRALFVKDLSNRAYDISPAFDE